MPPITQYLIVLPLVFLAGFVDAIAGGGGLVSLPAYHAAGLMPALAGGSNKLSAFFGTTVASIRYAKEKQVAWRVALVALIGCVPGSALGAYALTRIPAQAIKWLLLIVLPAIAVMTVFRKQGLTPKQQVPDHYRVMACFLIGFGIGLYDGFVGPGTGSLLILLFVRLLGLNPLKASGTAKIVNWGSNISALVTLILAGQVLYRLAIPAAVCAMLGNDLGAKLALKKGVGVIRGVMIGVMILLFAVLFLDAVGLKIL